MIVEKENYVLVLANGMPSDDCLIGIFELDQAKALYRQGQNVIFLALDLRSIRRKRFYGIRSFYSDGVLCYHASFPVGNVPRSLYNLLGSYAFNRAYKRVVRENGKPKLIHAHFGRAMGYFALIAKQKYGIEYIITEHDSYIKDEKYKKAEGRLLQKVYNEAKNRIAVSVFFQKKLQQLFSLPFEYVPNIVDMATFSNVIKIPHKYINIVSVGSLQGNRKGMDVTIRAYAKAKQKNGVLGTLTIIGEGSSLGELKKIAENEGVARSVVFAGQLSRKEIAEHFALSDIFILTSRNETFGVVYIEAMCAGLPVIATKCGGPEGIFTEKEGRYVQVDDIEGTSQAILEMAERLSNYNQNEIKEFCISNYSPEAVGAKLKKLVG